MIQTKLIAKGSRVASAALVLPLVSLLGACTTPDVRVEFANDPLILRGMWIAKDDAGAFVADFDLQATYIDSKHYMVSGSVTFVGEEPVAIAGEVRGHRIKYLSPQTALITSDDLFYATTASEPPRYLYASAYRPRNSEGTLRISYEGEVQPLNIDDPDEFASCPSTECFSITLERSAAVP